MNNQILNDLVENQIDVVLNNSSLQEMVHGAMATAIEIYRTRLNDKLNEQEYFELLEKTENKICQLIQKKNSNPFSNN